MKPQTNWHLVVWPILVLWIIAAIYVFNSEWRESAGTVLPIFMGAVAFAVLLLNAIAGSSAQRRHQLEVIDETVTACMGCGTVAGPLHVIEYHWYLFLLAIVIQSGQRGKFCPTCGRARVDAMFRKTLFGSILCPPLILWAWFRRRAILAELEAPRTTAPSQ